MYRTLSPSTPTFTDFIAARPGRTNSVTTSRLCLHGCTPWSRKFRRHVVAEPDFTASLVPDPCGNPRPRRVRVALWLWFFSASHRCVRWPRKGVTPRCDANGEDGRVLLQRLAGRVYQDQRHNLPLLLLSIAVDQPDACFNIPVPDVNRALAPSSSRQHSKRCDVSAVSQILLICIQSAVLCPRASKRRISSWH